MNRLRRLLAGAACVLAAGSFMAPAQAHHGWAWADGDLSSLSGTVERVSMAPPHPSLQIKTSDGKSWQVDLGNPTQTERSGFKGDSTQAGDAITVLGNRHQDHSKAHIKAVRITVKGQHFDMYPERLPASAK